MPLDGSEGSEGPHRFLKIDRIMSLSLSLSLSVYSHIGVWGVNPTGKWFRFVSFVRASVRVVWLPGGIRAQILRGPTFSICPFVLPSYTFSLVYKAYKVYTVYKVLLPPTPKSPYSKMFTYPSSSYAVLFPISPIEPRGPNKTVPCSATREASINL